MKLKRTAPKLTRGLTVPLGVAWDGAGPVIPPRDLLLPDGRRLTYEGPWRVAHFTDSGTYHTENGLWVGAGIDESYPALGPRLQVSVMYRRRDPSWPEITGIKAVFFGPDVACMMLLPEEQHFVHGYEGHEDTHVFHVFSLPPAWACQLWPPRGRL